MKNYLLISAAVLGLAAFSAGCDDDTDGTGGAGSTSNTTGASMTTTTGSNMTTTGTGNNPPPPPALGAQVDRFGRPAINTALNNTFEADTTIKNTKKDEWNASSTPTTWGDTFSTEVQKNLAILDALDANCGNQLGAAAGAPSPTTYSALAGVLARDRLWINTAAASSTQYLGVELAVLGGMAPTDGGGRSLSMDVIDVSYSGLAAGVLMGVGDNVAADADTGGTSFPYLAAPH